MSFTIGEIDAGKPDKKSGYCDHTTVSIVDDGIMLYHYARYGLGGGLGTHTPEQARELGQLLINAADRWDELNSRVKQIEAEREAMERGIAARIKDVLR